MGKSSFEDKITLSVLFLLASICVLHGYSIEIIGNVEAQIMNNPTFWIS